MSRLIISTVAALTIAPIVFAQHHGGGMPLGPHSSAAPIQRHPSPAPIAPAAVVGPGAVPSRFIRVNPAFLNQRGFARTNGLGLFVGFGGFGYFGGGYDDESLVPFAASPGYPLDFPQFGPAPYTRSLVPAAPLPNDHPLTARLELKVPQGAEVWINNKKVETYFTSRTFESPEMKSDETYKFDVRVAWKEDGKLIEQKRVLEMKQGELRKLQYIGRPTPLRT